MYGQVLICGTVHEYHSLQISMLQMITTA